MAAVTICSDFGAQENKVCHCFDCFPICLPRDWMCDGTRCHDLLTYYSVIQRKYQHHPDAFLKFIITFLFYVFFGHAQPRIEPVLSALETFVTFYLFFSGFCVSDFLYEPRVS